MSRRPPSSLRVKARPGLTGRCPYCRSDLEGMLSRCVSCKTTYHRECWGDLKGCAIVGCASEAARAPRPATPEPTTTPVTQVSPFRSPGPRRIHANWAWGPRVRPPAPWYDHFTSEELGNTLFLGLAGVVLFGGVLHEHFGWLGVVLAGAVLGVLAVAIGVHSFNQHRLWKRYHEDWLE